MRANRYEFVRVGLFNVFGGYDLGGFGSSFSRVTCRVAVSPPPNECTQQTVIHIYTKTAVRVHLYRTRIHTMRPRVCMFCTDCTIVNNTGAKTVENHLLPVLLL